MTNHVGDFEESSSSNKEGELSCEEFEALVAEEDFSAALSHLNSGRPIYYCDDKYPTQMIREWPDGTIDLVEVDKSGKVIFLSSL